MGHFCLYRIKLFLNYSRNNVRTCLPSPLLCLLCPLCNGVNTRTYPVIIGTQKVSAVSTVSLQGTGTSHDGFGFYLSRPRMLDEIHRRVGQDQIHFQ